jgi:hypothetical protein
MQLHIVSQIIQVQPAVNTIIRHGL